MSTVGSIVLLPNEYIHILNEDDGKVHLEIGPKRVVLKGNERLLSAKQNCIIVDEDSYAVILNPFNENTGKCVMGDRKVVEGPTVLALQYNEKLEGSVTKAHVLGENQAMLVEATQEHDDKPAGFRWRLDGPCRYIPSKYEKIVRAIEAIHINEGEGIYVKDVETAKTCLVRGPQAYMLNVNEEVYAKPYKSDEVTALGLSAGFTHWATSIYLMKGEVICILDYENNKENVIMGPCNYLLGPTEGVRVLSLSAGKPKKTNMIKAAKIRLGPDFMSDIFVVRTRDNADIQLHLTYKWQFLVDESTAELAFALNDFIGYACQSMCSGIREEAARHDFEEFHNRTVTIIRNALFKKHEVKDGSGETTTVMGAYFPEVQFLVSEVDVKEVSPVNEEIGMWLNQSIKRNMVIVCQRIEQEANLTAQMEKVQGQAEIQRMKETLIDIENENFRLETVQKAKIEGQSFIESAKAEKEAKEIKERAALDLEIEKMTDMMTLLQQPQSEQYIDLIRAQNFAEVRQSWYVTTDSKVKLPFA